LYLLDLLGGRHALGNPVPISGSLFFGSPIARDLEHAIPPGFETTPNGGNDLVVLDSQGVAHFVQFPVVIPQQFFFSPPPEIPMGRAVDLEMSRDHQGVYVLTDFGGIFRAGTAKPPLTDPQLPNQDLPAMLGYDVPIPSEARPPELPNPGGATLRAVGFAVIRNDGENTPSGFVILDSQGGFHRLSADGSLVPSGTFDDTEPNDPRRLLDPAVYVAPFFVGLDIARDIELHPTGQGLIVFDGWGGIHPVPVNQPDNPVYFANNRMSPTDPTPVFNVGLPYIVGGFDNPDTAVDEGDSETYGIDAASIFIDLVFCGEVNGFYTLDKFGGIFAFGSTRPQADIVSPSFDNAPFFFPQQYAVDIETIQEQEDKSAR